MRGLDHSVARMGVHDFNSVIFAKEAVAAAEEANAQLRPIGH